MTAFADPLEQKLEARTVRNEAGAELPYRIHVPKVAGDAKVPVILFLHGAGERGSNNVAQLKHGVASILSYSERRNEPVVVIVPQCPTGKKWVEVDWSAPTHTMPEQASSSMALALQALDEAIAKLPVDPKRVYVTGISMGGYGTWDVIARRAAFFAAAMPVCGGGDPASAPKFKDLPIWVFHGDADKAVPVARSRAMMEALKAAGGSPKYTEYPGVGHDSWTQTYASDDVLAWLFAQKRP
jgi:predicted peptidase